ncbi:DUF3566 domain-containing protein [Actinoplanes sp. NPDC051859]|uniref:DUF3566 domain-containing protein n=1 Tax=Actinoplanes sp. NPDC051859 TaxID=3363909 RepID=UPI003788DA6F
MPETQAKSGGSGPSASSVGAESKKDGSAAKGQDAAGRAAVPADAPAPKFTRAPGMAPPPGEPSTDKEAPAEGKRPAGSAAKGSATVPIVTKGKSGGTPAQPAQSGRAAVTPPPAKPATVPQRPGAAPKTPASGAPASGAAAVGAARVSEAVRTARSPVAAATAARGPRRARLNLKRIDPWSVMKFAFAVSVVLFIVVVVATSVLYLALDAMGVWSEVNKSLQSLVNASGGTGSSGGGFRITAWGVIGTSMLIGAVNVVLFTALATLGAFIYNVCADLVGGVELTLAERD